MVQMLKKRLRGALLPFVQVSLLEWAGQTSVVSLIIGRQHVCGTYFTGFLFSCTGRRCIDLGVLNSFSSSHCYACFLALQCVCHSLHLLSQVSGKLQHKMKHIQKQLSTSFNSWGLYNCTCWEASCTFFAASWIRYFNVRLKVRTFDAKVCLIIVNCVTALKMHEPGMLWGL